MLKQRFIKTTQLVSTLTLFSLLTACGGGGSDSGNGGASPPDAPKDANQAYTGARTPALLDTENTLRFSRLLFGTSSASGTLQRPDDSASTMVDATSISQSLNTLAIRTSTQHNLQQRSVSDAEDCTHGGNITATGEVDDSALSAVLKLTFNNCEDDLGTVINGSMDQVINSIYDYDLGTPDSYTVSFDGLTITQGSVSFSQTGSVDYFLSLDTNNFHYIKKETINLTSTNNTSGAASYLEDYNIESRRAYLSEPPESTVSGKAYLHDEGYITISGSDPLNWAPSDTSDLNAQENIPARSGYIALTGASNSEAKVSPATLNNSEASESEYRIDLDADGDGVYELTSIQDYDSTNDIPLAENKAPVVIITANTNSDEPDYGSYSGHPDFKAVDTIYLFGNNSYDIEGDNFAYTWTVESKPAGSNAQLGLDASLDHNTLTTDAKGVYEISLKATETGNATQQSLAVITIDQTNVAPVVEVNDETQDTQTIFANQNIDLEFKGSDIDSLYDGDNIENLSISYELIEQPIDSQAEVTHFYTDFEYYDYSTKYASSFRSKFFFNADLAGTYKFKLTATDVEGLSGSKIVTINVIEALAMEVSIRCVIGCVTGSDAVRVNQMVGFDIIANSDYTYSWTLDGSSTDSTGIPIEQHVSDRYSTAQQIQFMPNFSGDFHFALEATAPWGETKTINQTITVVN